MTAVILVGGPGGAGSSTAAARLADALAATGASVGVAGGDPEFGASTRTGPGCVVLRPEPSAPSELHDLSRAYGVDGLIPALDELTSGGIAGAIWALTDQVDAGVLDHVVVDVGSALRSLHVTVRTLAGAASRAQGLNPGWLRSARPLGALGLAGLGGPRMAESARAVAARVDRLAALIGDAPSVVIHSGDTRADDRTRAVARAVVLGSGRLGAVHGVPGEALRDRLRAYTVPVVTELDATLLPILADPPRQPVLSGGPKDPRVIWRVPLPFNEIDEVEVDRIGDSLMVRVGASRRLFNLPSLLARHTAHGTRVRQGMLEVAFTPTQKARP
ncbi:ArsA family ATPase [Calidifontibacter terrae]